MSWFGEKIRHGHSARRIHSDKSVSSFVNNNPKAMVYFSQEGCGACRATDPIVDKQSKKRNAKVKKVNLSKVSVKNFPGVTATPTIRLYKEGKQAGEIVGVPEDADFKVLGTTRSSKKPRKPSTKAHKMGGGPKVSPKKESIQKTGCIGCSSAHIAGASSMLNESIRFADAGGVSHPEVVRRLVLAREEIVAMERIDLSEEAIANSPKRDQELAAEFKPRIRLVRQHITGIKSVNDLKKTAREARQLNIDFTKAQMGI